MADIEPDIGIAGTLGPLGDFPVALAEHVSLGNGVSLLDYIASHGGSDQWVFGHGDPPTDLTLTANQRYFDQDSGRVWAASEQTEAETFVANPEPARFTAAQPARRFVA